MHPNLGTMAERADSKFFGLGGAIRFRTCLRLLDESVPTEKLSSGRNCTVFHSRTSIRLMHHTADHNQFYLL